MNDKTYLISSILLLCTQSALIGSATPSQQKIEILPQMKFDKALNKDLQNRQTDTYPETISLLKTRRGTELKSVAIWTREERCGNDYTDAIYWSFSHYSPLAYSLRYSKNIQLACAIARTFPEYIEKVASDYIDENTDDEWPNSTKTALEFYIELLQQRNEHTLATADRNLLDLLKPLINKPDANGVMPIFSTCRPDLTVALHMRGARVDAETIQHASQHKHKNHVDSERTASECVTDTLTTFKELGVGLGLDLVMALVNRAPEETETDKRFGPFDTNRNPLCKNHKPITTAADVQRFIQEERAYQASLETKDKRFTAEDEKELFEHLQSTMGTSTINHVIADPGMSDMLLEKCSNIGKSGMQLE